MHSRASEQQSGSRTWTPTTANGAADPRQPTTRVLHPHSQWLAHPGELGAAEAFAVRTQREALAPLPEPVTARVVVTATVHTDAATFLYNQPTIEAISGT